MNQQGVTGKAYITKVVVEGFKSYGRRRKEIPLGEGFIAIVGPNGAGKSNIGDAISFALGLASSKVLRAKNLSYLIWNKGNQKADYAEVEVHFKNLGAFPLEEEEIIFSRKVFPNGRSVFKINGKTVKEREVKELLTRAGITENAYNVVLQGDIIHFLKMTPLQRRKLIEEIAGIGEFDEKKHKALEELGEVELKLKELKLILEELEKQLQTLERDRQNLALYRELKKRIETLQEKINLKRLYSLLREKEKLQNLLEEKKKQIDLLEGEISKLKGEIAQRENQLREIETLLEPYREKIGKLQSEEEFLNREKSQLEERLKNLELERESLLKRLENLQKELEEKENLKKELLKRIETLKGKLKPLEENLLELERQIENLEGKFGEALKLLKETEKKLADLQRERDEKEKLLRVLLRELDTLDGKIEQTEENLKRLEEEKRELLADFVGSASYEREKLEKLLKEKEVEYQTIKGKLQKIDRLITELSKEREDLLRELIKLEAQQREGGNETVEFLKKNVEGVYGTVAELIRVPDEEYLTAIEVAGGNRLRYVVVENEDTAKRCIDLLKQYDLGRLTFIPLNKIRAKRPDYLPRTAGVIDFVYRLVDYDPYFEKAVLYVFGDTILVRDFETAKRLGIGIYRMVTPEGELFEKGGTITGGRYQTSNLLREGYIRSRLEEIKEKLSEVEKKLEKLKREYEKTKEKLWEVEGVINYSKRRLEEYERGHNKVLERIKKLEERIKQGLEYLEFLKKEREEKEQKLEKLQDEIVLLEEQIDELKQQREKLISEVSNSGLENLRLQRVKLLKEVENLKKELSEEEKKLLKLENLIENLKREIKDVEETLKRLEEEKENTLKRLEEIEQQLEDVKNSYSEVGQTVSKLVEEREKLRSEKENLEKEIALLTAKLEKLTSERDKLLIELAKVEQNIENLKEEIKNPNLPEPEESLNQLQKELKEAEEQLKEIGSVNFRAEEEYEEVKNRYREYKEKYQTLLREKRALTDFIGEIEKKKTKIFLETFKAINKNFKEIFSFLSPGGKAYMELEKPHDPFAGGINMFVKPRGKEVKYLEAMSGGEKTLAALSLIFALQRYKPAPFYYFDEVDAHLDEANAVKVGELIKEYSKEAQFIVVTLRESVAYLADRLIGVTSKGGVSEVYFLDPAKLRD